VFPLRSPIAPLRVVRVNPTDYDPALDDEAMIAGKPVSELAKYIQTRDPDCLHFRPESNPVWFDVSRLPMAFLTDVLDSVFPVAARRLLAFRAAVHLVSDNNGPVTDEAGHPMKVYPAKLAPKNAAYVAQDGEHGVDIAPMEFAQEVADRYSAETIQELGQVAIDFARLPRGKRGPFSSWAGSVVSR
jgi:hypothetical protein